MQLFHLCRLAIIKNEGEENDSVRGWHPGSGRQSSDVYCEGGLAGG